MRLDGIDHITAITSDGQRCLDFYAGILGLTFLGREPDFEAPESHLIRLGLGQCENRPEGVLAFVEAPGIRRGIAGNGMAHRLSWTVRQPAALTYWAERLSDAGIEVRRLEGESAGSLRFADPEGLEHELTTEYNDQTADLTPSTSAVPREHAIVRLAGIRAYGRESVPSADILAGRLAFRVTGPDSYAVGAAERGSDFSFDRPPQERGRLGAGTIHHIAWSTGGFLPAWRQRVIGMGCVATPVIDRGAWHSIYFREPSGVLFEITAPAEAKAERVPLLRRISPKVDPRIHGPALA
jgi:glyoxalase family protein